MKNFSDYESMAMFNLSDAECAVIKERFDNIVDGFSALDAYDVDDVEPAITVLDLQNVMRKDVAISTITREDVLKNAPEQNDGYFQVPAAIE
ncbi:MAG: Asp-tRNA(Asn)/Glu-tRNA(Gln) amidotransferase subunit GatC [Oscillospiraceae bacterium]|nr:Asp-tRNA(Asn)/Glu-tRNA(Gln) amidotransferase subunit GatC [Oscillospiraceae bacterium]